MMKTAYIFPGQGSQYVGMGRDLAENNKASKEVFEAADRALGFKISQVCFEGDEGTLKLTANSQPAILSTSIAALRALQVEGLKPDYVAGHSLGEYSGLVTAGSLCFEDAVKVVRQRGLFMQEAAPPGVGAMAAILGTSIEAVEEACKEVTDYGLCSPANINSPGQIVIAGNREAVEKAIDILKEKGAKRAIMLPVSAPFHCDLMKPAAEKLSLVLNGIEFQDLSIPLVTNVDAAKIRLGSQAREALVRQVASPVKWSESIKKLLDLGVTRFVEIGPGRVLSGLVKQISRECRICNIEDMESLRSATAALGTQGCFE